MKQNRKLKGHHSTGVRSLTTVSFHMLYLASCQDMVETENRYYMFNVPLKNTVKHEFFASIKILQIVIVVFF